MTNKIECLPHLTVTNVTIWTNSIVIVVTTTDGAWICVLFDQWLIFTMGDDIEDTTSQICFRTYPDFNDFSSTECLGTKWSLLKRAHAAVDRDKWSCISMLSDISKMTKVCFHHCCNGVGLRTVLGLWGSWGVLEPFQDTSWENRKTLSTEWIKYSYLNALALEWPRCFSSSTCFFVQM